MRTRPLAPVLLLALAGHARAQHVLETFFGAPNNLPSLAAEAGDTDGDGYVDILISSPSSNSTSRVWLYSGRTSALLFQATGANDFMGMSIGSAGDLNGDGKSEYFIGVPEGLNASGIKTGYVDVRDGATGNLRFRTDGTQNLERFGWSGASIGDVNSDGVADLVFGSPEFDTPSQSAGRVRGISGLNGAQLFVATGTANSQLFGYAVTAGGDLNGDSIPDALVGAPAFSAITNPQGYVRAISGLDGSTIRQRSGVAISDGYGISVASAGDLNGDGLIDFAVAAPYANFSGLIDSGSCSVLSGADLTDLYVRGGGVAYANAGLVSAGRDYDGDGSLDVVYRCPGEPAATVRILRGSDGVILQQLDGGTWGSLYGGVRFLGDLDHNGTDELFLGGYGSTFSVAVSFDARVFDRQCAVRPNSVGPGARMEHVGSSSISANDLTLTASGLPSQRSCLLFFGTSTLQVPFFDGYRCPSGQTYRLWPTLSDSQGNVAQALDFANGPATLSVIAPGSSWTFQFFYRDTGFGLYGANTTDGMRIGFGP